MSKAIRENRLKLGLSQDELAKSVGCKRATIAGYEGGFIRPSVKVAKRLSRLFGISLDELLHEDEPLEAPLAP